MMVLGGICKGNWHEYWGWNSDVQDP